MQISRRRFVALVGQLGLLTACQSAPQGQPPSPNPTPPPTNAPVASVAPPTVAAAAKPSPSTKPAASPIAVLVASPSPVRSPVPIAANTVAGKPMYQMDPQHTGRSPHRGSRQLTLQRSIDLTAPQLRPADAPMLNTPDIQSATVVGPDGTIYATTFSGWTYALKDSAGARDQLDLVWRFRPAEGGTSAHGTAAVAQDGTTVYVAYGLGTAPNQMARMYALKSAGNGQNATIVWQSDIGSGTVANSPTLTADGTIYYINVNGLLSVLDPSNGRIRWSAQTGTAGDAPFGQTVKVAPAVAPDGTVYTTAITGSMYAISPPSGNGTQGSIKWSFDFGQHPGTKAPVTAPVTNGGNRGQDGVGSAASVTIGPDGTLYVGANNSNFYAIDANGQMKWMFEAERELAGIWTTAALSPDGSQLYFGANKGGMYALNTRDGSLRWQFPVYGSIYSSAALDAAGTLYTGSSVAHVYAINAANGEQVADYNAGTAVWTAPSIRPDGTLVVGTRSGTILVLG